MDRGGKEEEERTTRRRKGGGGDEKEKGSERGDWKRMVNVLGLKQVYFRVYGRFIESKR